MLTLRKASDRFHTQIDWLDSWHSFSFGEHHDPRHMGFGPLRVINDDRITGGGGFPTHGHRDMEIITIVLTGVLEHKDSLGNGSRIRPGDVQKMSAGLGILHSEFNANADIPVHLLQIWITPSVMGIAPSYQQIHFDADRLQNKFCLIASHSGAEESVLLHQDARILMADIATGETLHYRPEKGRKAWVQLAGGNIEVNQIALNEGDGLAVEQEMALAFCASAQSKVLLFDLDG